MFKKIFERAFTGDSSSAEPDITPDATHKKPDKEKEKLELNARERARQILSKKSYFNELDEHEQNLLIEQLVKERTEKLQKIKQERAGFFSKEKKFVELKNELLERINKIKEIKNYFKERDINISKTESLYDLKREYFKRLVKDGKLDTNLYVYDYTDERGEELRSHWEDDKHKIETLNGYLAAIADAEKEINSLESQLENIEIDDNEIFDQLVWEKVLKGMSKEQAELLVSDAINGNRIDDKKIDEIKERINQEKKKHIENEIQFKKEFLERTKEKVEELKKKELYLVDYKEGTTQVSYYYSKDRESGIKKPKYHAWTTLADQIDGRFFEKEFIKANYTEPDIFVWAEPLYAKIVSRYPMDRRGYTRLREIVCILSYQVYKLNKNIVSQEEIEKFNHYIQLLKDFEKYNAAADSFLSDSENESAHYDHRDGEIERIISEYEKLVKEREGFLMEKRLVENNDPDWVDVQ